MMDKSIKLLTKDCPEISKHVVPVLPAQVPSVLSAHVDPGANSIPMPDYGPQGPVPSCHSACVDCLERCRKTRGDGCHYEAQTCYEVKMMCCRMKGAKKQPEGRSEDNESFRYYGTDTCSCG